MGILRPDLGHLFLRYGKQAGVKPTETFSGTIEEPIEAPTLSPPTLPLPPEGTTLKRVMHDEQRRRLILSGEIRDRQSNRLIPVYYEADDSIKQEVDRGTSNPYYVRPGVLVLPLHYQISEFDPKTPR